MDVTGLGKVLMIVGGMTVLAGLVLVLLGHVPMLGRLPGDITIRRGAVSCYIPIVTSIVLSVLLTLLLNVLVRWLAK